MALPDAHEVEAWGEPTFRIRNKLFAMYASAYNHHGGGRPAVWCKAGPGNQELMVGADPGRFFRPPYVGPSGWVGIYLDRGVDWAVVAELLGDAYRLIAPKSKSAAVRRPAAVSSALPRQLGRPALRALEAAGVHTLAAATRWREADLAALHGIGPKALGILKRIMAEHGLALAPSPKRKAASQHR